MKRSVTLSEERLAELLKAAYIDGFQDGTYWLGENPPDTSAEAANDAAEEFGWPNSVSLDQHNLLVLRVRAGGRA